MIFAIMFLSCRNNDGLESEYLLAGNNQADLEEVINHYKDTGEKEKLAATIFLIKNMPEHAGVKGIYSDEIKNIYENIVLLNDHGIREFKFLDSIAKIKVDSLKEFYGNYLIKSISFENDINSIEADYLIENIDHSFYMWKNMPWAKHVNFDDFCEYILPYRVYNEPLSDWRKLLSDRVLHYSKYLKDTTDPLELCKIINDSIYPEWKHLDNIPNIFPCVTDLNRYLGGTCQHHHLYMTSVFRSVGIPTCIDDTPQNNDWKDRHAWIGILAKDETVKKIDIGNPDCEFVTNVPLGKGGATKVYRRRFEKQSFPFHKVLTKDQIPKYFKNKNQIDVTIEYTFPYKDISIKLFQNENTSKYVFLCAPDLAFDIRPVAISPVKNSKVKFENVGYPALYFCATFDNRRIVHHSNPIFINKRGERRDIVPQLEKEQKMRFYRKYKPSDSVLVYVNEMVGAKVQGSNSIDFEDATDLYAFSNPKDFFDEIELKNDSTFRYFRYIGNPQKRINLSEFEFIGRFSNDSIIQKLSGIPVSNVSSYSEDFSVYNAFDGDIRTNCLGSPGTWIGIDLQDKKASLSKIRYMVRNHFNIVEVNDFYELFYFDGQTWVSKGIKKAANNFLEYDKVPVNTVYVLRNLSRGRQERMFLYENGLQFYL
ncbi:MAG: transglutaminase-like domain-containing protein [Prolixibacteraceae bacterium]|nr:transglutaminase-like domain-containing protein [Prolixibacteraceae bacterium]